jgi:hypothetical protein
VHVSWVAARTWVGVAASGVTVLLAGTLLPWLRSGATLRNSYQAATALHAWVSGAVATLLTVWPVVITAWALCIALYALRLRRVSAVLACLFGVLTAAVAVAVLGQDGQSGALIGPVIAGPAVTLIGATLAFVGAIGVVAGSGDRKMATTRGPR